MVARGWSLVGGKNRLEVVPSWWQATPSTTISLGVSAGTAQICFVPCRGHVPFWLVPSGGQEPEGNRSGRDAVYIEQRPLPGKNDASVSGSVVGSM